MNFYKKYRLVDKFATLFSYFSHLNTFFCYLPNNCCAFVCKMAKKMRSAFCGPHCFRYSSANISLPTEHNGHSKSSGRSSNFVPGAMPKLSSPSSSSYVQPHASHTYFAIFFLLLLFSGRSIKHLARIRSHDLRKASVIHGQNFLCALWNKLLYTLARHALVADV